ncbi:MAG TPA: hypothetical protein VG738_14340 [Chitinophagaceae bacterium]|nr:hypothetical protein [Chitinophagaceae bacterium]
MNEKLGELIWHLLLLGGFVYAFLIMHKLVKTSVDVKTLQRPTVFIRLLVYIGLLVFALAVVLDVLGK